jgi:DNA-binding response OmpR family regulator
MLSTEYRRSLHPFDMSSAHEKKRVLCVEDNPDTCHMITTVLSGFEIVSAFSVEEAWRLYNNETFSLIILDYRLDDGNGIELCERIRRRDYQTPIIFMTGHSDIGEANVRMAGGQRLVRKGDPAFLDSIRNCANTLAVNI